MVIKSVDGMKRFFYFYNFGGLIWPKAMSLMGIVRATAPYLSRNRLIDLWTTATFVYLSRIYLFLLVLRTPSFVLFHVDSRG